MIKAPKKVRKTMAGKPIKVGLFDLMSEKDQDDIGFAASGSYESDLQRHGSDIADKNYEKNIKFYSIERFKRRYGK